MILGNSLLAAAVQQRAGEPGGAEASVRRHQHQGEAGRYTGTVRYTAVHRLGVCMYCVGGVLVEVEKKICFNKKILSEISDGTEYKLVGFVPLGKAPIRANTELFGHDSSSDKIGWITSGSFSPTLKHPIALGYVKKEYSIQLVEHFY